MAVRNQLYAVLRYGTAIRIRGRSSWRNWLEVDAHAIQNGVFVPFDMGQDKCSTFLSLVLSLHWIRGE